MIRKQCLDEPQLCVCVCACAVWSVATGGRVCSVYNAPWEIRGVMLSVWVSSCVWMEEKCQTAGVDRWENLSLFSCLFSSGRVVHHVTLLEHNVHVFIDSYQLQVGLFSHEGPRAVPEADWLPTMPVTHHQVRPNWPASNTMYNSFIRKSKRKKLTQKRH